MPLPLPPFQNVRLSLWIEEMVRLCQPDRIHLCDGSDQEYQELLSLLVEKKTFVPLQKRPGSYWCHSHPDDVARVEEATFICTPHKEDAGPTNNWRRPEQMLLTLREHFAGAMQGRAMYIIPYCMGPLGGDVSHIGVQLTDSEYVACHMRLMTRMGSEVLKRLGDDLFVPCVHSVGVPLPPGKIDPPWPCNPEKRLIVHFPEDKSIWSFGSGYGGNALLGKKAFALRIASVLAREEGWLAEHMLILSITSPEGKKKYIAASFPSCCGKTNLAMLTSTLPGWKVECIGDDIAWMKFGKDGRLYAVNPEAGIFGVAPGTSSAINPAIMKMIERNTLFTNVALDATGDVWWEGMSKTPPPNLTDWKGERWTPEKESKAAHPNARFTASLSQCPTIDPEYDNPEGVPIDAILFGGRRSSLDPLVYESLNWKHGVFLGATLASETTAAAKGTVGQLRRDPFSMLPFCGYHMGDYFAHWLSMEQEGRTLPKIYRVNWFRKDDQGKFLWPGFGENVRVLKWIYERLDGKNHAELSAIGYLPHPEDLDLSGLSLSREQIGELLSVHSDQWPEEIEAIAEYFCQFGEKLPKGLQEELVSLHERVSQ